MKGMKLFIMNNKKSQEESPDFIIKEHKNRKNSVEKKRIAKIKLLRLIIPQKKTKLVAKLIKSL